MIYALQHSQYAEDNGLYPFYIGTLVEAVRSNLRDAIANLRQEYQIIFIGSYDECVCQCNEIFNQKLKKHPEWIKERL